MLQGRHILRQDLKVYNDRYFSGNAITAQNPSKVMAARQAFGDT